MTNEEFQRIVLEEFKGIKEDIGAIKEDVEGLKEDVGGLKKDVEGLKKGQREIRRELGFVWDGIKKIDNRLEEQKVKISKVIS